MEVNSNRRRLDIFALDLLGEWTAVHGSLVWRQVNSSSVSIIGACCALILWSVRLSGLERFSDSRWSSGSVPLLVILSCHILQADFLNHAVETILALYADDINSVIIVGHSMGGLVARYGLLLLPSIYVPPSTEGCTRLVHHSSWMCGIKPMYKRRRITGSQ